MPGHARRRLVLAVVAVAGLGPAALAQDAAAPTFGRPAGGLGAPLGNAGTSGSSGLGLSLRPGIGSYGSTGQASQAGSFAPPEEGPAAVASNAGGARVFTTTTGYTPRPGLRPPKTRRLRRPTNELLAAPFRATIAPPGIAAEVQPIQTGVPDPAIASPPARRKLAIDDPYAPLGLRFGGLTVFPLVGQSLGYDTNPNRTRGNRHPSFLSQTEGELRVQSDWSNHELTGNLRGAYNEYPSNEAASRPEGAGRLGFRYDVSRDTQADIEGHYLIDTQRPDSPNLGVDVRSRPIVATEGGSVGMTQRFNRLLVTLRGTVDRTDYENVQLTSGSILDQADRNLTQFGGRLRTGYEIHPGLIPFAELQGDTRVYDKRIDSSGFRRTSDGVGGRIGTTFEITRLLTGEVSAGAIRRSYDDPRLKNLTSPIAEGALTYALTPLTTIRATASAGVDETTIPNANGIRTLRGGVEVSHDLRRNVTLSAALTAADYAYQGVKIDEHSFGATLRADWRLNRNVTLRASYAYEKLSSSVATSSYTSNVMLLGVRLQP